MSKCTNKSKILVGAFTSSLCQSDTHLAMRDLSGCADRQVLNQECPRLPDHGLRSFAAAVGCFLQDSEVRTGTATLQ